MLTSKIRRRLSRSIYPDLSCFCARSSASGDLRMIRDLFDSLTIRLTMLLILALASIAGAGGFLWLALSDTEAMPELLDKIGRQRMLSIQMVASAHKLDGDDQQQHRRLMESADDFDATIELVRDYEERRRLKSGQLDELLAHKIELWEVLRADIEVLVDDGSTADERQAAQQRLIEEGPELSERSDAIVQEIRGQARQIGERLSRVMIAGVGFNLLLVIFGYLAVRRWIVDPLGKLECAAHSIQNGDLDARLEESYIGEIGTLETTFNKMAREIERLVDSVNAQRELAEAVVQYAPAGVVIHRQSEILLTNPEFISIFGGQNPCDIDQFPELFAEDDRSEASDVVLRRGASDEVSKTTRPLQLRDQERSVEVVSVPIEYGGQQASMVVIRDVTERQRFMARMIQIDRVMATGSLASGIGHEINNPLSFIAPNLEFSQRQLSDWRARWDDDGGSPLGDDELQQLEFVDEALDEALEGAQRIGDIVDRLRTFANHERRERRDRIDIGMPLEAAVQMVRGKIRQRAVLQLDVADDLPSVEADASKLAQVFVNLLLNAVDAIDSSNANDHEIGVQSRSVDDAVIVEIRDTGCGIDPEVQKRIFDPFFTTKPPGEGTGLGLASCQAIVEDHGGILSFHSEVGEGTVFRVELPIADGAS